MILSASIGMMLVLTGVVPPVDDGLDARVGPDHLDQIDVIGSTRELWQRSAPGGTSGRAREVDGPTEPRERYCPPTLYTHGMLREIIYECDGAGGTELTPVFDTDEIEDIEEEDAPQFQPIVVSREDVQSLLVSPGNLLVQPDRPWVLVNADTIVMTDAAEQVLSTQVLDLDVDVRATPVLYTWDFGDGSPPVTGTDPGAPWPHHTVSHAYPSPGTAVISVRTEWDAEFRVRGSDTWVPVLGRAVTEQSTDPIEVVTATPRLTSG